MSSGSPVPCPRRQDQPSSPDLAKGARVWYHQLGEWLDAYVLAWNAETVHLQPVGRAVDEVTVRRQQVALEQPRAMEPCSPHRACLVSCTGLSVTHSSSPT